MSSYGPPGQQGQTPYGEPVDPFSGPTSPAEGWSAPPPVSPAPQQPYVAPSGYAPGQAAPSYNPGYVAPDYGYETESQGWQPPRRQGSKAVVVLVTVFVVLVLIGAALTALLLLNKDDSINTSSTCPSTPTVNPHCFDKDECLLEQGKNAGGAPLLLQVPCNTVDAYQVLDRFDGTTDEQRCNGVAGLTRTYYFDANKGTKNDLVLCLKKL